MAEGGEVVEEDFEDAFSMLESWDQPKRSWVEVEVEIEVGGLDDRLRYRYLMMILERRKRLVIMIVLIKSIRKYSSILVGEDEDKLGRD